MNTIGYFEIQSSNTEREIAFYKAIFDWKFVKELDTHLVYYRIETGGITGGLLERPAPMPEIGASANAFVSSIEVSNFDKTAAQILSLGGKVSIPKFAVPYRCWQGYFTDEDNNCFGIFQVDEKAR